MCAAEPLDWAVLPALFPDFAAPGRWLPLLQRHAELLAAAAPAVRTTSVTQADMVRRHYAESLELARLCPEVGRAAVFADVGSGGGFPGIVIAALYPGLTVHLLEPLRKRARLLAAIAAALGLDRVAVHAERGEEAGRGPLRDACDVVAARAVAPLGELLEYTAPLAAPGGVLLLPKGTGLHDEVAHAKAALSELCCHYVEARPMREEVNALGRVAVVRKLGDTPPGYPRRPGVPGRRPIAAR